LSDQQVAELYDRLAQGKKKETSLHYPFQRGWNAAIDFAIRQLRLTCDEPIEEAKEEAT
jgi:hypothetical protein